MRRASVAFWGCLLLTVTVLDAGRSAQTISPSTSAARASAENGLRRYLQSVATLRHCVDKADSFEAASKCIDDTSATVEGYLTERLQHFRDLSAHDTRIATQARNHEIVAKEFRAKLAVDRQATIATLAALDARGAQVRESRGKDGRPLPGAAESLAQAEAIRRAVQARLEAIDALQKTNEPSLADVASTYQTLAAHADAVAAGLDVRLGLWRQLLNHYRREVALRRSTGMYGADNSLTGAVERRKIEECQAGTGKNEHCPGKPQK